jgi:hypothetical protein
MQVYRKNTWLGSLFIYGFLAAVSLVFYPYGQAQADIGGVGSPYDTGEVEVKYSPAIEASQDNPKAQEYSVTKTAYAEQPAAQDSQVDNDPVMIIRFNKKNVYYRKELKKVVDTVSGVRPEAVYAVQSVIPDNNKRYGSDIESTENLKGVVRELSRAGVPIEKIKTNVTYSDSVRTQEIRIFIQ